MSNATSAEMFADTVVGTAEGEREAPGAVPPPVAPPSPASAPAHTAWLAPMLAVARHYRLAVSEETVRVTLEWERGAPLDGLLERMARQMGLVLSFARFDAKLLDPWRLPLLVELADGQVGLVDKADGHGRASLCLGEQQHQAIDLGVAELRERVVRVALLRPESSVPDARVDGYIQPYQPSWFWRLALRDWARYSDIVVASVAANLLALSTMLFSMQIYDRVVPAQSEPTLWVLFGGVAIALCFEFMLRLARTHVADLIGKRADLKISDVVFGRALRLRNDARSKSTGSFISQIRELESVRELITSTSIGAVADLPFVLLFIVVLWLMAGPLAFVALAALPLIAIPGLLAQRPLARLSREGMRESALRNAMLVEAVEGIEDIKLLRAEPRFQNQWNQLNRVSADIAMKQRFITSLLTTWTQELQSGVYAVVLLAGAFLVMKGEMTTGTLVAASILASRMMAPLAQLSAVFARWQQAKVARQGLNELMQRPIDQPERSRLLHRPALRGAYSLEGAEFRYDKDAKQPALSVADLKIAAGERVAILGRMGAGKSTLLQLLAGMQVPQQGKLRLDGVELSLIDPGDVRRDMGLLTQNARLFYGTLRDNLTLGLPQASDEQLLQALTLAGALPVVHALNGGLDYVIHEGGLGLSGGQQQALLLARTLMRQPQIVLLDEPTASFDEGSEAQVIDGLLPWLQGRTLVVATHRMAVLKWVDRIIVVDNGRIAVDGAKADVLSKLSRPR